MEFKSQQKLLAIAIVILTSIAMVQTAFAADVNTLRLYGEDGMSTPNFPYETPEGPFDPLSDEAPYKDFMTFNPALFEDGIVVNHANAYEKVFARQYFVPNYEEPTGRVWLEDRSKFAATSNDIVTEYTYMMVNKVDYQPIEGTAMDPQTDSYWTKFWFPIADNDDDQIGLDGMDADGDGSDDMVHLEMVGDFDTLDQNADGYKDVKIATDSFQLQVGDELQFLDHMVVVKDVAVSGLNSNPLLTLTVDVYYTGNDEPQLIQQNYQASIVPGDYLVASRHTVADSMEPDFDYSWFLRADAVSMNYAYVTVGRRLYQGESFFVDGAEYDVAAIFGSVDDGSWAYDNTVKYITIRNPVPEDYDVDLGELSVIKESVSANEMIPLLPPFNREHIMIDDIDLPVEYTGLIDHTTTCYYGDNTNVPARKLMADALEIYFVDESMEERFDTNLLEILDEGKTEQWQWLDILTKPYQYKEFVYPALPDVDDSYADFILTSSFEAPYTKFCYEQYGCLSMDGLDKRLMFEYDQETGIEDIYVNEIDANTNGLRLYGGSADVNDLMDATFPYSADNPEGPFDPLNDEAPEMDFVTMSPAVYTHDSTVEGVLVNNDDSTEKVFIRQWFDPDYTEPAGEVWLKDRNKFETTTDDIVTEYTYMLTDLNYYPVEGTALDSNDGKHTYFWFPIADNDDAQIGLDGMDINGDEEDDMTYLRAVTDYNDDGRTDIVISSDRFQLQAGVQNEDGINSEIQFLDHKVAVKDIAISGLNSNPLITLTMDIYYTGNDEDQLIEQNYQASIVPGGAVSVGRHVAIVNQPDVFEYPWFITADSASEDYVYVTVGRVLYTGESFFVDGAEYDVAMIYGSTFEGDDCYNSTYVNTFKYITIRNPVPEEAEADLGTLSVIKEPVQPMETIPLLPPFNGEYCMIDDIDLDPYDKTDVTCYYDDNTNIASRVSDLQPALDIYYTGAPETEERFHSNLFELLCECTVLDTSVEQRIYADEYWKWLHIRTLPDEYKEFVYPDVWNWDGTGDYLVTSSFTAPNSDLCEYINEEYRSLGDQRLMFYHDPANGVGLYMNQAEGAVFSGDDGMKGDYNEDGHVTIIDFAQFAKAYNNAANYDDVFDFDNDGDIDIVDFAQFAQAYEFD
ncbi:dockerin type I domain-containing protein [uncultured Methanolobus sp.]|uniref:dockerin type I domain-containing protein n=1 Tax=uncultured Methanolobus sp. TaxID=218300 RepID=UPI002AAC305E|nr:dockerin type I domain-containing protein [uncultured Methanolobus sp.]